MWHDNLKKIKKQNMKKNEAVASLALQPAHFWRFLMREHARCCCKRDMALPPTIRLRPRYNAELWQDHAGPKPPSPRFLLSSK